MLRGGQVEAGEAGHVPTQDGEAALLQPPIATNTSRHITTEPNRSLAVYNRKNSAWGCFRILGGSRGDLLVLFTNE